jgi:hypothetical protein
VRRIRDSESHAALERLGIDPNRLPRPIRVRASEYRRVPPPITVVHTTEPVSARRKVLHRPGGRVLEVQ